MNLVSMLLWGFVGTVVLTTILSASQGLGLTRMNIPFLLGTMFTANRDRAKVYGFFVHLVNGWMFSVLYAVAFMKWGGANVWRGMLIGFVHGMFVLTAVLPMLPGMHPRMASEHEGPRMRRTLEPPGFFALHYGLRTPASVLIAHLAFGAILGFFYRG